MSFVSLLVYVSADELGKISDSGANHRTRYVGLDRFGRLPYVL